MMRGFCFGIIDFFESFYVMIFYLTLVAVGEKPNKWLWVEELGPEKITDTNFIFRVVPEIFA